MVVLTLLVVSLLLPPHFQETTLYWPKPFQTLDECRAFAASAEGLNAQHAAEVEIAEQVGAGTFKTVAACMGPDARADDPYDQIAAIFRTYRFGQIRHSK